MEPVSQVRRDATLPRAARFIQPLQKYRDSHPRASLTINATYKAKAIFSSAPPLPLFRLPLTASLV